MTTAEQKAQTALEDRMQADIERQMQKDIDAQVAKENAAKSETSGSYESPAWKKARRARVTGEKFDMAGEMRKDSLLGLAEGAVKGLSFGLLKPDLGGDKQASQSAEIASSVVVAKGAGAVASLGRRAVGKVLGRVAPKVVEAADQVLTWSPKAKRAVEIANKANPIVAAATINKVRAAAPIADTFARTPEDGTSNPGGVSHIGTTVRRAAKRGWLSFKVAQELNAGDIEAVAKDLALQDKLTATGSYTKFNEAKTYGDTFKAWIADPISITAELVTESMAMFAPSIPVGGAVGKSATAAFGPVGGLVAGALVAGGGSANIEISSGIIDAYRQMGVDVTDAKAFKSALSDVGKYRAIRATAMKKGIAVGVFDAVSVLIGGRLWGKAGKSVVKKIAAGTLEMGIQGAMGGGGEITGSVLSGQAIQPAAVLGEVIGELGPGAVETAYAAAIRGSYDENATAPQATPATLKSTPEALQADAQVLEQAIAEGHDTPEIVKKHKVTVQAIADAATVEPVSPEPAAAPGKVATVPTPAETGIESIVSETAPAAPAVKPTTARIPSRPELGDMTIADDTDPAMVTLTTSSGGQLRVGRAAVEIIDQAAVTEPEAVTEPAAPEAPASAPIPQPVAPQGGLKSQSGRVLSPVPANKTNTDRGQKNTSKAIDAWLVDEGNKEAAHTDNDWMKTLMRGMDPKRLSPADRDMLNMYLFDDVDGVGSTWDETSVRFGQDSEAPAPKPAPEPVTDLISREQLIAHIVKHSASEPNVGKIESRLQDAPSFELADVDPRSLTLDTDKSNSTTTSDYAKMSPETSPAITLNANGEVVDGRHRVAAAIARGDSTIKAYRPPYNNGARVPGDTVDTLVGKMDYVEFEAKEYDPADVTKEQYVDLMRSERRRLGTAEESGTQYAPFADYENYHREAVERRLKAGEVDPRVLASYPDLVKKPDEVSTPIGETSYPDQIKVAVDQAESWKSQVKHHKANIEGLIAAIDNEKNARNPMESLIESWEDALTKHKASLAYAEEQHKSAIGRLQDLRRSQSKPQQAEVSTPDLDNDTEVAPEPTRPSLVKKPEPEAPAEKPERPSLVKKETEALAPELLLEVDADGKLDTVALAKTFMPFLDSDLPVSLAAVKAHVAKVTGLAVNEIGQTKSATGLDWKAVEEAYEYAIVTKLHEIAIDAALTPDQRWEAVKELYANQPNLTSRDSNSRNNQQYSTPAPIAWALQEAMGLQKTFDKNGGAVYEPTAGNGMLVAMANPDRTFVNELDPGYRTANLKDYGFATVTTENAVGLPARHDIEGKYTFVIMNPPFGGVPKKSYTTDAGGNYRIGKIEHQIALDSLDAMRDDGKAAIIIGGHNFENPFGAPQAMTAADEIFFNYLYSKYNVTHNIDVSGDLYSKMGTKFPIRVLMIDGRKPAFVETMAPENVSQVESAESFDALRGILQSDKEVIPNADTIRPDERSSDGLVGSSDNEGITEPARSIMPGGPPVSSRDSDNGTVRPGSSKTGGKEETTSVLPSGDDKRSDASSRNLGRIPEADVAAEQAASEPDGDRGHSGESDPSESRLHAVIDQQNDFQSTYPPHSKVGSVGTRNTPTKLVQPVAESLRRIADIHGDLDVWVAKELGYPNVAAMAKGLADIQVDAVALALHSAQTGTACIIGDQTGVGKGRVAAAIMKYAKRKGLKPIFLTANPNLFSDIYRDIVDIGDTMKNPLILGDVKRGADIVDEDGNIIFKAGSASPAKRIEAYNANPDAYDYILAPYTQFSHVGCVQQQFLIDVSPKSFLIMDESHLAAGTTKRGLFFRHSILARVPGVTYLSATYAKSVEAFALYWRTALGAGIDREQMLAQPAEPTNNRWGDEDDTDAGSPTNALNEVIDAINEGGVPYQEWAAIELAKAGNYARREPDFGETKGVGTSIDEAHAEETIERADKIREILRDIVAFDAYKMEQLDKDNKASKAAQKRLTGSTGGAFSTTSTSFGSRVHNFISQLLLASKADYCVEQVIQAVKDGKKPIIALSNTMEAFLKDHAENTGTVIGELIDIKFEDTLHKALARTLRATEKAHDGTTTVIEIPLTDLSPEAQGLYHNIEDAIDQLETNLPASFIDYVSQKLRDAGLTVGEITGRGNQIEYGEDGSTRYVKRKEGSKDRKATVRNYNNGDLDVMFINTAGATGISAHNSPKFKDHRERIMFIAQPELNIDTEIQKLGRIFRYMGLLEWEGKDVRPSYVYLLSALCSEIRPAVVNQRKLKKMNANTSGNATNAFNLENIPDIMNAVGDGVVADYFSKRANAASIHDFMGAKLGMTKEEWMSLSDRDRVKTLNDIEDLAAKTTGKIALLPEMESRAHLEQIEDLFNQEIKRLDDLDENPLVSKTYDWAAQTQKKSLVAPGTNNNNAFTSDAYIEELSIKSEFKPYNAVKVNELVKESLKGTTPESAQAKLLNDAQTLFDKRLAGIKARYDVARAKFDANPNDSTRAALTKVQTTADLLKEGFELYKDIIEKFKIGTYMEYNGKVGRVYDLVVRPPDTDKAHPFLTSKIHVRIASTKRTVVDVPWLSRETLRTYKPIEFSDQDWTDAIADSSDRETRYVITGNLTQAFKTEAKGGIINYTTEDGALVPGYLLSTETPASVIAKLFGTRIGTSYEIADFIKTMKNGEQIESLDGLVKIHYDIDGYHVSVPAAKAIGSAIWGDYTLEGYVERRKWFQNGRFMEATVSQQNIVRFLDAMRRTVKRVEFSLDTKAKRTTEPDYDASRQQKQGKGKKSKRHTANRSKETKPVSERDVVKTVIDAIGILYRQGRMGATPDTGRYKLRKKIGRAKNMYDIPTATHEAGHELGYAHEWNKDMFLLNELAKFAEPEQLGQFSSFNPEVHDEHQKLREGIAEYVRYWVTDYETAASEAPAFTEVFESALADHGILKSMMVAQKLYYDFIMQNPMAKLTGAIDFGNKVAKQIEKTPIFHGAITDIVDDLYPLRNIEEALHGVATEDIAPSKSFYKQARMSRGAHAIADLLITKGDGKTQGLEAMMHASEDDSPGAQAFQRYMMARRQKALQEAGKPTGVMDPEDTDYILNELDSLAFRKGMDIWNMFNDNLLEIGRHFSTPEARAQWKEIPDWVPQNRVVESAGIGELSEGSTGGAGKGLANQSHMFHEYKGTSHALYQPPLDTVIERTYKIVQRAMQNDAVLTMVDALNDPNNPREYQQMAERIPASKLPVEVGQMLKQMLTQMDTGGLDVSTLPDELFDMTYWKELGLTSKMKNARIVFAMREGKPEFYQIRDKVLYDAIVAIPSKQQSMVMKILGAPAHVLRTMVTGDPGFLLYTNLVRDSLSAWMVTEGGFVPFWDTIKNIPDAALINSEAHTQLVMTGGGQAGTAAMDRVDVRKKSRNIVAAGTTSDMLADLGETAIEQVRQVRDSSEMTNRIAVFKSELRAIKKKHPEWSDWDHLVYAGYRARDLLDFAMRGRLTGEITQLIAFSRSKINGMAKAGHEVKRNPKRILMVGGMLAMATAMLYYLNRDDDDYWELSEQERNSYWHIKQPGSREFIRIPKNHEFALVFGTGTEDTLRFLDGNREAFASYPDAASSVVSMDIPNAMQIAMDLASNTQSNTGAPIAPEYLNDGRGEVRPEDQFGRNTSTTFKALGRAVHQSPAKLEYAAKQLGGNVTDYTTSVLDWMIQPLTHEAPPKMKSPLSRLTTSLTPFTDGYDRMRTEGKAATTDLNSVKKQTTAVAQNNRAKELGYKSYADLAQKETALADGVKATKYLIDGFFKTTDDKHKYAIRDAIQAASASALAGAGISTQGKMATPSSSAPSGPRSLSNSKHLSSLLSKRPSLVRKR